MEIKRFEIGKKYYMNSVCDINCVWSYEVIRRTKSFVFIKDSSDNIIRKKINVWDNTESCMPLGVYSMAPCLTASKEYK